MDKYDYAQFKRMVIYLSVCRQSFLYEYKKSLYYRPMASLFCSVYIQYRLLLCLITLNAMNSIKLYLL